MKTMRAILELQAQVDTYLVLAALRRVFPQAREDYARGSPLAALSHV